MRTWIILLISGCCASLVQAHHPETESRPVHRRIDLIGPLGNRLPASYRWRYNRPTNIGGRIAYYIAPTSQEAMRWHRATHQGQYRRKDHRMVANYFYPKPWESLRIGARPRTDSENESQYEPEMGDERESQGDQWLPDPTQTEADRLDTQAGNLEWNQAEIIEAEQPDTTEVIPEPLNP